jgi:hypothetical protein
LKDFRLLSKKYKDKFKETHDHHVHKRDIGFNYAFNNIDQQKLQLFLKEVGESNNLNTRLIKRNALNTDDMTKIQLFLSEMAKNNNLNTRLLKRAGLNAEDQQKMLIFLSELAMNNNLNTKLLKRSALTLEDREKMLFFLNAMAKNNNLNTRLIKRDDAFYNEYLKEYDDSIVESSLTTPDEESIKIRAKRASGDKAIDDKLVLQEKKQSQIDANEKLKEKIKKELEIDSDKSKEKSAHSAIGVTLVLGFVFMLIVDQIGGKFCDIFSNPLEFSFFRAEKN